MTYRIAYSRDDKNLLFGFETFEKMIEVCSYHLEIRGDEPTCPLCVEWNNVPANCFNLKDPSWTEMSVKEYLAGIKRHNMVAGESINYCSQNIFPVELFSSHAKIMISVPLRNIWERFKNIDETLCSLGCPLDKEFYDEVKILWRRFQKGVYRTENMVSLLERHSLGDIGDVHEGIGNHVSEGFADVIFYYAGKSGNFDEFYKKIARAINRQKKEKSKESVLCLLDSSSKKVSQL